MVEQCKRIASHKKQQKPIYHRTVSKRQVSIGEGGGGEVGGWHHLTTSEAFSGKRQRSKQTNERERERQREREMFGGPFLVAATANRK